MRLTQRVIVNPELGKAMHTLVELSQADMRAMTQRTDRVFRTNERSLFQSQGVSGGSRWPNLSAAYAKAKRKKYGARPVLVRTGELRKAAQQLGGDHVARFAMTPPVIELGIRGEPGRIGTYHHDGAGRLPRRSPIQMTPAQVSALQSEVRSHLVSKLKPLLDALLRGAARARALAS